MNNKVEYIKDAQRKQNIEINELQLKSKNPSTPKYDNSEVAKTFQSLSFPIFETSLYYLFFNNIEYLASGLSDLALNTYYSSYIGTGRNRAFVFLDNGDTTITRTGTAFTAIIP